MNTTKRSRPALAIASAGLMLALSACAPGGGASSAENPGKDAAEGTPGLIQAIADVEEFQSATGTFALPVLEGGPEPTPGKEITIISCGETSSSCARATEGAVEAAETIGWTPTVFDTKGDYSTAATGIRQAIASKADGIFIYFIDCSYMRQPLEEAKAAGIPVVQAEGADCNAVDESAPSLFTWSVTYNNGPLLEWVKSFTAAQAAYAIAETNGRGNILMFADNAAVLTTVQMAAFEEQMASCAECEYEVVTYSFTQMANGLSQQVGDALTANPNADTVIVAYDALLQAGVSQAVQQVARTGREILLIAGEGQTPTMELVREGVVDAGSGLDNEWEAWSGIDSLSRLMNGQDPVSSGIGNQIYDAEHNLPDSGPYVSPVDFRAAYKDAWGVD